MTSLVYPNLKSVAKERPRSSGGGHFYTPKRTRDFEDAIRAGAIAQLPESWRPYTVPLHIVFKFDIKIPDSWSVSKKMMAITQQIFPQKGDLDNRVKAVSDGLNGILYLDDIQIVHSTAMMRYSDVDCVYVSAGVVSTLNDTD